MPIGLDVCIVLRAASSMFGANDERWQRKTYKILFASDEY